MTPPILWKLNTSKSLIVHLWVSVEAIRMVLVQEEGSALRLVYFVSRVLLDLEMRYQVMEKVALALVNATRCLRQYFQSHRIIVWTKCPIAKDCASPSWQDG